MMLGETYECVYVFLCLLKILMFVAYIPEELFQRFFKKKTLQVIHVYTNFIMLNL